MGQTQTEDVDSTDESDFWAEKFEDAMMLFVGKGTPTIYREGYRNDLGNLCTGKTQGYWERDRSLAEARDRGIPAVDVREVENLVGCAWNSPLLAQHPDKVDEYDDVDDVGSFTRATPRDYMMWWDAQGADTVHFEELPDWE